MSETKPEVAGAARPTTGWRIKLGFALFLFSLVGVPLLVSLVALLDVPGAGVYTGGLLVASEGMLLLGAAVAGKEGFAFIKTTVFGFLRQYGPPARVGPTRYRIGLVMLVIPLVFGWASPYVGGWIPGFPEHPVAYGVAGDLLLGASLFVLGGDFWDKLQALFIQRAYVVVPDERQASAPA